MNDLSDLDDILASIDMAADAAASRISRYPVSTNPVAPEERDRRTELSAEDAILDAVKMCAPCRYCGNAPDLRASGKAGHHDIGCGLAPRGEVTRFCVEKLTLPGSPYVAMARWNDENANARRR